MNVLKCPEARPGKPCREDDNRTCPAIDEASRILDNMGLVVYPTDTVYGLAGLALYPEAVEKVFRAKGRPGDVPITATVASYEGLLELTDITSEQAEVLAQLKDAPITWVLPALDIVPERLLAGGITLGVRVLTIGCAAAIVNRVGPITATSANVHGQRSARKVQDSMDQMGDSVDLYIDCGKTAIGIPSTVAKVVFEPHGPTIKSIKIIREGAISGEALRTKLLPKPKKDKPTTKGKAKKKR